MVSEDVIVQAKGKRAEFFPQAIGHEASILLPASQHKCLVMLEVNEKLFWRIKSMVSDAFLKFASPLMIKEKVHK